MKAREFTGDFAGVINFMSYKFEDGGSYKRLFNNLRKHPRFRQEVLDEGKQLAIDNGNYSLYEGISNNPECFIINEFLHDRYSFERINEPKSEMIFFSNNDLQLLENNVRTQILLPFYKIPRYKDKIDKYLLMEDDNSCLFLADGMMRLFQSYTKEFAELSRFYKTIHSNEFNPCLITVAKSPYLYDPIPFVEPVVLN